MYFLYLTYLWMEYKPIFCTFWTLKRTNLQLVDVNQCSTILRDTIQLSLKYHMNWMIKFIGSVYNNDWIYAHFNFLQMQIKHSLTLWYKINSISKKVFKLNEIDIFSWNQSAHVITIDNDIAVSNQKLMIRHTMTMTP